MPAWLIIWENRSGAATQSDCQRIEQTYGLERVRALIPVPGALESAGMASRHAHWVLRPDGTIEHKASFRDNTFEPVIQQLLAE